MGGDVDGPKNASTSLTRLRSTSGNQKERCGVRCAVGRHGESSLHLTPAHGQAWERSCCERARHGDPLQGTSSARGPGPTTPRIGSGSGSFFCPDPAPLEPRGTRPGLRRVWSALVGGRSQQVAGRPPFPTTRRPQLQAIQQLGSCSGMVGRAPDARSREARTRGGRCTRRTNEQRLGGIAVWLGAQGRHNQAPCAVPPSAGAALRGGPGSPAATSESIRPDFSL